MLCRALASLVLLASSCLTKADVPDPPDLGPLVAAYDHPSGVLTPANAAELAARIGNDAALLAVANPMATLWTLMDQMGGALRDQGISTDEAGDPNAEFRIDAVAATHLTCPGWAKGAASDPNVNGTVVLQTVVQHNQLSRVVWGDASGCKAQVLAGGGVPATFDGALTIYRYNPIATALADAHYLVQIGGKITTQSSRLIANDFRIGPAQIEIRTGLVDGSGDVVGVVTADVSRFLIRARNGDFMCSGSTRLCTSTTGAAIPF